MSNSQSGDELTFDDLPGNDPETVFDPLEAFPFRSPDDQTEDGEIESTLSEGPYNLPNPDAAQKFKRGTVSFTNGETAELRIDALFDQMPTLHGMLYDILGRCEDPIANDELHAHIVQLKSNHHCIYEASSLCDLLDRAGAICQTDENGTSMEDIEQEPLRVEIDGEEYWKVAPAPTVYWLLTDEGRKKLASYRPLELIQACVDEDIRYGEIYDTVLSMCSQEGGTSLKQIGDVIDDEPALQEPKRYATFFIDKLERAGALDWNGQWTITQAGRDFLSDRASE